MISKVIKNTHNIIKYSENQIYIKPHDLLKPYIAHYTISFPAKSTAVSNLTIIPDASGCFIFTFFEDKFESSVWGPMTKTTVVSSGIENYCVRVFVEFLTGGLYYFTRENQINLTDLKVPLWQVNSHIPSLVAEAFQKAKDLDNFLEILNFILLPYIIEKKSSLILINAIEQLKLSRGIMSVKELSSLSNYSERHLNRIFNECTGMNIKTFSKLIRINNSIENLKNKRIILSSFAQDNGFYDEAHFIHDFKSICGITPKKYLSNMSDFYNEVFKF